MHVRSTSNKSHTYEILLLPTALLKIADGQETRFDYGQLVSNGSNIKVVNNGHTVQVVSTRSTTCLSAKWPACSRRQTADNTVAMSDPHLCAPLG